jgi:hypothetical protein
METKIQIEVTLDVEYTAHAATRDIYYGGLLEEPGEPAWCEIESVRDSAGNKITLTPKELEALRAEVDAEAFADDDGW